MDARRAEPRNSHSPAIKAREWASRSKFQFAPAWRVGLFKRPYLLTLSLLRRVPQSVGVDRLARVRLHETVGKAEYLKTSGITDDPKVQLAPVSVGGRNLDKARQTSLLFDGSIDAGRPAT